MEPETRLQHHGEDRPALGHGAAPPIFRTSLFTFSKVADLEEAFASVDGRGSHDIYTRLSNPTTRILEAKVADLEESEECIALASGMAAITSTLLGLLKNGDHALMVSSAYEPTLLFAKTALKKLGIDVEFVSPSDFNQLASRVRPETRMIYLESPSSLTFEILDLDRIVALAREQSLVTVMDNSWSTPLHQKPLTFGIDVVVHSGTKYLSGHSDILLGVVAGRSKLLKPIRDMAVLLGASLSPEDAFLAIRGLRTLGIRMERHGKSGLAIATHLEQNARVEAVHHPGLATNAYHKLARKYLRGWSALFSFTMDAGADEVRRFVDALVIFQIGVSWGGFESLVIPSGLLTSLKGAMRSDVPVGLVRLSVGLEDPKDLIADLERGFAAM
jgi:cystathionine beta-lyase